jgi:hypothetical protein
MKKIYSLLVLLFLSIGMMQAQFVDFGESYDIQKGDFAVGDIDNDGDLDIIFSGENNGGAEKGAILINNNGIFTEQEGERVITIGKGGNIKFGDIDGDGDLDVIFCGWGIALDHAAGIALNDGHGVFTLASESDYPIISGGTKVSCGFADFNNDGLLDYYFFGNGLGKCALYFQEQNGSFTETLTSFEAFNFVEPEVTVVDFNNDGYLDIFISAFCEEPEAQHGRFSAIFKNDGFGGFLKFPQPGITFQKANGTTSWGDVDGDGWLDMVLNGDGWLDSGEDNDGVVRLFKNENGIFAEKQMYEWYRQNSVGNGSAIIDWDNDGDVDIFIGGWNGAKQQTAFFECTAAATFTFAKSDLSDSYFYGISEQSYRIADLDGDGKNDLLFMGYSGGTGDLNRRACGYIQGNAATAYSKPEAPTGLNAAIDDSEGLMITLTWNAPASEATKKGTTYNLALKNKTTGKWLYNPMAVIGGDNNGWRKTTGMGNVFTNKRWELYDLPDGEYEWTVQAINGGHFGGAFAATETFKIGETSINSVTKEVPKVTVDKNRLSVKSATGVKPTVNVFAISGVKAAGSLTSNLEVTLPTGVYIVEVIQANATPYRTKVVIP